MIPHPQSHYVDVHHPSDLLDPLSLILVLVLVLAFVVLGMGVVVVAVLVVGRPQSAPRYS